MLVEVLKVSVHNVLFRFNSIIIGVFEIMKENMKYMADFEEKVDIVNKGGA